ncbi:MAG: hypothetical protein HYX78_10725 [Armatimonadetes bacterium]|nr:hypothetical protein [Armatimonadota bacterium]
MDTEFLYKDNGLVDTIIYPNGTKTIFSYNSRNWLTTISNQNSDGTIIIAESTYTYDPTYWGKNGTRTQVVQNILKPNGSRINAQVDYEYDDFYRLVHEKRSHYGGGDAGVIYNYQYDYDAAGNRIGLKTMDQSGKQLTYTSYSYDDANKMTGTGITYDDKGNLLTYGATTYTWDYLNRLTRWEQIGATTQDYIYNADGIRVRKTPQGGTATDFLLDGAEVVEAVTGSSVTSYVGPGVISEISGTTQTVCHSDGAGSSLAITNSSGAVQEAALYKVTFSNCRPCRLLWVCLVHRDDNDIWRFNALCTRKLRSKV